MSRSDTAPESEREVREVREELASPAQLLRHWRLILAGVYIVISILSGFLGPAMVILVLASGALILVITTFWASIRTLFGETPLSGADAYAIGAPRAEEEQKQAVLRALKDLEFERSVGKISEEDYQALVTKYRAEAKRLLRLLDEDAEPRREQVEVLVQKRLQHEGLLDPAAGVDADAKGTKPKDAKPKGAKPEDAAATGAAAKDAAAKDAKPKDADEDDADDDDADAGDDDEDDDDAGEDDEDDASEDAAKNVLKDRVCASCGTINDGDAVFCKKCGARQDSPPETAATKSAGKSDDGGSKAGA
jgi:ribosomal protein L40E